MGRGEKDTLLGLSRRGASGYRVSLTWCWPGFHPSARHAHVLIFLVEYWAKKSFLLSPWLAQLQMSKGQLDRKFTRDTLAPHPKGA